MTQTKIEIIVTGDNATETIEQIAAQLPAGTTVLDGTQTEINTPTIDDLLEDAVIA